MKNVLNEIYDPINIIGDLSSMNTFVDVVNKIESEHDADAKAAIAKKFIDDKDLIKKISYEDLKRYLSDESSIDVTLARRLYLLERSIPRRQGDTHTWLERLKIFADTSTLEHSIIATKNVLGKKLYFTRKSGDHEALHYGAGSYAADFYYWDDIKNKAVFVEFKHWRRADIESAKEYYKDKIYSASNVIVCTGDHRFYWIDYIADSITEIDNIIINDKLLIW